MRKTYPYLQESYTSHLKDNPYLENPYVYNLNKEQEKRGFLSKVDNFLNQRQYINMTLLDWHERPIKEIDGIISSGSISKDGSSSVRRTASLSCSVDGGSYNVDEMEMDFSLNKKIFIEIGVKNETDQYPEWPILWFPQGVFYINSFSMNSATSSAVNLTLQLKDKMCLLNGDVGGTLPSTVQFDKMTTQLADGTITEQDVLYYNIITELVHHWGGEDLNNIIIQDVPLRIRRVMQWNGENDIYLSYLNNNGLKDSYQFHLDQPTDSDRLFSTYSKGDDVGYVYSDFIPTGEITGAAGDTVCTVLDTIKNQLGNYEYFYDVYGIFHFREIRNYLNITQSDILLQEMGNAGRHINLEEGQFQLDTGSEIQYLVETTNEKTVYSFSDATNLTSITVTPSYENIKNDFVINGIRQSTTSDKQYLIRYRCVIDEKPEITHYVNSTIGTNSQKYNTVLDWTQLQSGIPYVGAYGEFDDVIYYTHPETFNDQTILEVNRLGKWYDNWVTVETTDEENKTTTVDSLMLPNVGNMDQIYRTINEEGVSEFWLWTGSSYQKVYLKNDPSNEEEEPKPPIVYSSTIADETAGFCLGPYYPIDWRTFLYLYGIEANALGLDPGPYYQDIYSFWPNEYNLRRDKQCFFGEESDGSIHYKSLAQGNFFFDIIDANSSSLGMYSVQNIGRRMDVYHEDNINCLFRPEIPNVVFLNMDDPSQNWSENTTVTELRDITTSIEMLAAQREECILNGQPWVQVPNDVFANLTTGGYMNSAYEALRYELFAHTKYQKVVSVTALPVFYLEPNSRVEVSDHSTNTYGDFMIQNINLTLGPGANMSASLSEVSERL